MPPQTIAAKVVPRIQTRLASARGGHADLDRCERGDPGREDRARVRVDQVRVIEQIAHVQPKLDAIGQTVPAGDVDDAVAGDLDLGRTGTIVADRRPRRDVPKPRSPKVFVNCDRDVSGRDVVERASSSTPSRAGELCGDLQHPLRANVGLDFDFDPADERLVAIAEEEIVRRRLVPLDERVDPVADRRRTPRRIRGAVNRTAHVELQARLRFEVRVAGDEPAARRARGSIDPITSDRGIPAPPVQ